MARTLLLGEREHFVERAKASAVFKDVEAKIAAEAARKAQRKTVNTLRQSLDSIKRPPPPRPSSINPSAMLDTFSAPADDVRHSRLWACHGHCGLAAEPGPREV
jgi:hypothetical protein